MSEFDSYGTLKIAGICAVSAFSFVIARLGNRLARDPIRPEDDAAFQAWKARRRWLIATEFMTLPALTTAAFFVTHLSGGSEIIAIGAGMVAGGVGLPFVVSAMRSVVRARLNMSDTVQEDDHA